MPDPIDAIDDMLLDDLVKGFPGGHAPVRLGDIGKQGWNLLREDLPLPLAVLKRDVLDANGRWMVRFLRATGSVIAPHGKTTMSPQLFQRQLADGAWAITVATVAQLQVCRRFGIKRLLLANQLVGRQAMRQVVSELARDPEFEFYALADSVEGVAMLAGEAKRQGLARPVNLLLEGGIQGARAGCRTREQALAVARAIKAASPHLALVGVEGFEGLIHDATAAESEARVAAFLDFLVAIAADCRREGLFAPGPVILSAGGSAYYDLAAERLAAAGISQAMVVLRSGCYLTQDSTAYRKAFERLRVRSPLAAGIEGSLRPALELWTYVQSRPEPGRLILTAGKRDVSYDLDLPVPLAWFRPGVGRAPSPLAPGHEVVQLNDQHAHVLVPTESPLRPGDMVALGISHPCTTFDKWQAMFLVDEAYDIVGAIRTFF
jgi:D-serine dehydratase